jgi:hypothetical protein
MVEEFFGRTFYVTCPGQRIPRDSANLRDEATEKTKKELTGSR